MIRKKKVKLDAHAQCVEDARLAAKAIEKLMRDHARLMDEVRLKFDKWRVEK